MPNGRQRLLDFGLDLGTGDGAPDLRGL